MPELIFGWTLPALLAGHKTSTRQMWARGPGSLRAGSVVAVYDRAARRMPAGQKRAPVAAIRLTENPTLEPLRAMPDTDYETEGWAWLHAHPESLRGPDMTASDFSWEAFERWRGRDARHWVVRFELVATADAPQPVFRGAT